jgi:cell division protein FtsZ
LTQISRQRGLLNYSLKEVRQTFLGAGLAEIGTGRGQGEGRYLDAGRAALESRSLFRRVRDAACVVLHVRMPASATLFDLDELSTAISAACDRNANLWLTVYIDSPVEDGVEITLFAAGLPRP